MIDNNRYAYYDEYGLRHLPRHLVTSRNSEKLQTLREMLLDFDWLYAKLNATDINALLDDYDLIQGDETVVLVRDALRLSIHVLAQDKSQLSPQLLGRLLGFEQPEIQNLLRQIQNWKSDRPWFRPMTPCLQLPGGALIRTLAGHSGSVEALALSADGKRLISGFGDIKIWDLEQGGEPRTLTTPLIGHSGSVEALVLSADGKRLISGGNQTIKIWDLEQGGKPRTLYATGYVLALALSADGKRLISGSGDQTIKIWDLEQGGEPRTLRGHTGSVEALALSADGKRLISGGDQTIKIWDLEQGGEPRTLRGHTGYVEALALSADGKRLISGSRDKTLKLWSLSDEKCLTSFHLDGAVSSLVASPDSQTIIVGDEGGNMDFLKLESDTETSLAGQSRH